VSDPQGLESSVIEGIADSEATAIAVDYAEIGLDHLLDGGVLEEIPVVSQLRALWKTGATGE
jgi:hypothetical protein